MQKQTNPAVWCLVLAFWMSAACHGQARTVETGRDPSALIPQQLQKLEGEWSAAFLHGDASTLDKILAFEFVLTDARGHMSDKAEEIASAREGDLSSNEVSELVVRVYGTTAIVTGRLTLATREQPSEHLNYRITDVWVMRDGRWQAVAGHISNLRNK